MYMEREGRIQERFPFKWCTCSLSRIESIPFYHAYPGSRCTVVGTASCNFRCKYCSNGFIAREDPRKLQEQMFDFSAEELISMAKKTGCHSIVFNVNEPAVSLHSLLKVSRIARENNIELGCLTNGYTTEESTETLMSIFSFINIGLKGFSDNFYRDYIGIKGVEPILRNIKTMAKTRHIEVTTPVIQSVNDSELIDIAEFLAGISTDIPWHVFRLLPEHDMKEYEYPSIEEINESLESARKILPYLYFHNFVGSEWVNTLCPECGSDVIKRFSLGCGGDRLDKFLCDSNKCPDCAHTINLLGSKIPWNLQEA